MNLVSVMKKQHKEFNMKKYAKSKIKKYKQAKFFTIFQHKGEDFIYLCFLGKEFNVFIKLLNYEWKNLIGFLKNTRRKDSLPKGREGFSGFQIDRNKPEFFISKSGFDNLKKIQTFIGGNSIRVKRWEKFHGMKFSRWLKLESDKINQNTKFIKKTLLVPKLKLSQGSCDIYLNREQFLKFRDVCLKLKYSK